MPSVHPRPPVAVRPRADIDGPELDTSYDAYREATAGESEPVKRTRRAPTEVDVLTRTIRMLTALPPAEADWVVNALNRKFGERPGLTQV